MNDTTKGLELLKETITGNKRHQDYDRVTSLATLYNQLFTGEGIEDLLRVYHKRSSEEQFLQLCAVYNTVMPSVANNLENVFMKPLRSNRVFSSIEHSSKAVESELNQFKKAFWTGEENSDSGVDAFLQETWIKHCIFDPNAFIAIEFSDFDYRKEKPTPFPIEYSSKEAIRYQYINGVLDYLLVELDIKYKKLVGNKIVLNDGKRYILYLDNDAIQLTQVDTSQKLTDIPNPVFIEIAKKWFTLEYFNTKSQVVPAKRSGYKRDRSRNSRTCLSIFHPALAFFKKELKAGSELDLSVGMHLFPQKLQFGDPCPGDESKGLTCKDGRVATNGTVCKVCNGSGLKKVSTSAQDVILVRRPKAGDPFPDLSKYVHYLKTDIEVIRYLNEYVDSLTEKATKAIFGGEPTVKKQNTAGLKTATEIDALQEGKYDALKPFTQMYSGEWLFCIKMIAIYTDNYSPELKLYHQFPADFKLKGRQQLYEELKAAKDANVPTHILEALHVDIAELLYADDQDSLLRIKTKNKFNPFPSKSPDEINNIITLGKTSRFYEVLYANFDIVFSQIDNEMGMQFYKLHYEKQVTELKKRVDAIILELDKQRTAKIPIGIEGLNNPVPAN